MKQNLQLVPAVSPKYCISFFFRFNATSCVLRIAEVNFGIELRGVDQTLNLGEHVRT